MDNLPPPEEMDQSLMDLGPFLGVSIKEEVLDEPQEGRIPNNKSGETVGSVSTVQSSGTSAESEPAKDVGTAAEGEGTVAPEGGSESPWLGMRCAFCSQPLHSTEGTPRLMECLHSACENCLTTKFKEKSHEFNLPETNESVCVQCPRCSVKCTLSGLIDQQFVLETREGAGGTPNATHTTAADQKCNSCSDDNAATAWCCECSEYICDVCVQAHQRLKITKDHTIKSKEEAMNESQGSGAGGSGGPQDMYCKEHTQEKLSLFCETCDRLTCRDCQLLRHRDHRYQFSSEMAGPAREAISNLLSEVSYKRVLLGSAMKVIQDRQTLIADKKKALVHEITQTVVKLTNAINTRGKQLVLQLNEVCDSKQKTLNEKKIALEQLSAITDHCIEFVNAALNQGSDTAILYTKKQITSHLQRIKSRRADIPNPEIPVRIHLALEKVPDLIKVMSAIGGVVVDGKVHPPQVPAQATVNSGQVQNTTPATSQGPYHPPAPSPSATSALQAMHHHQQLMGGVNAGGAQRGGQPSPSPLQTQQQFNAQQQSQLAHLSQMSAQLQRQNSTGNVALNPLAGVIPQMRGAAGTAGTGGSIIRHPHVTSSTHPHHITGSVEGMNFLQGMQQELNLRGLLSSSPSTSYQQQQQQQQHQQQQQRAAAVAMQGQYSRQALQAMQSYQGAGGYNQQTSNQIAMYGNAAAAGRSVVGAGAGVGAGSRGSSVSPHASSHPHNMYQQMQHQMAQQPHHASAKWHIPQNHTNGVGVGGASSGGGGVYSGDPSGAPAYGNAVALQQSAHGATSQAGDASFKITIRQPPRAPSAVTSTNPKTPSPNLHGMNMTEAVTNSMDKLCQDSVNDLMATIAKLDSNGVQVLAEGSSGRSGGGKGTSPLVHSSTDDVTPPPGDKSSSGVGGAESEPNTAVDPNEDWCAVCMDGGELMCCDKCPKVFHQYCHIPIIDKLPDESESWQCLLCVNFADVPELAPGEKRGSGLTIKQQNVIQRIVLELYCQYEASLHFREPVPQDNVDYHSKIKRAMALDTIRLKLQPGNPSQYTHVSQLVADVRLMFSNAFIYNPVDSVIYKDAKRLEEFFEQQLAKWLPAYCYGGSELMEDQNVSGYKRPRLNSGNAILVD